MRERGHSLEDLKEAGREGRLAFGFAEELFPRDRAGQLEEVAEEIGLEPELIERILAILGTPAGESACSTPTTSRRCATAPRVLDRRLPPGRLPAAGPGLRPVDAADRRRRGPPLPPLRARTADPRRRAGARDGGGDGRPRRRHPAPGRAAHRVPAHPLPALLPRAGRGRPHGERPRQPGIELGQVPITLCFIDLTGFTRYTQEEGDTRRSTWSSASSPRSRRRCRRRRRS